MNQQVTNQNLAEKDWESEIDNRNLNEKYDNRNLTTKLLLNSYSKNIGNQNMTEKNCELAYDRNK